MEKKEVRALEMFVSNVSEAKVAEHQAEIEAIRAQVEAVGGNMERPHIGREYMPLQKQMQLEQSYWAGELSRATREKKERDAATARARAKNPFRDAGRYIDI